MTAPKTVTFLHTFRLLWKRAYLWRFSLMSASLCTLLFALFPPLGQEASLSPSVPQATYNPPPAPDEALAQRPPGIETRNMPPAIADLSLATPGSDDDDAIKRETGFDRAVLGRLYSNTLRVDGFDIPLPEGHWAVLANAKMNYPSGFGMGYFLGKIIQKRLAGGVFIIAMRTKQDSLAKGGVKFKWKNLSPLFQADECAVGDDSYSESCWMIYNYFAEDWQRWADKTLKMDPLMKIAVGNITAKGIAYPQDLVAAMFVRTEKWGMIVVRYMKNPEMDSIKSSLVAASSDSDWAPENISRYPEKIAYVNKIKKWSAAYWEKFKAMFSAGASFPAPNIPSTAPHQELLHITTSR